VQFNDYPAMFTKLRMHKKQTPEEFYTLTARLLRGRLSQYDAVVGTHQANDELDWYRRRNPYYNVWPSICKMLLRLDLGVVSPKDIHFNISPILFRFAKGQTSLTVSGHEVRTVLVSEYYHQDKTPPERWLCVWVDFGETYNEMPVLTYRQLNLELASIEESFEKLLVSEEVNIGVKVTDNDIRAILRVILSCCLISTGSSDELISPIVLNEDLKKYEHSLDPKYIEKAARRGKIGWDIGKDITVNTHYRNSHLALFWIGEGRATPVIKLRKGSIIHREVIEKLPTGYLAKED
jgi:hypothetical protein